MPINRRHFMLATGAAALAATLPFSPAEAMVDPEVAGYIPVKGGRIWYRMNGTRFLGKDKAPLLLINGGPGGTHRSRLPLVALSDERPVILYDQLDTGHADHPGDPKNWTVDRFVSEIDSIREFLKLPRIAVLGHSWGGTLAAVYGTRQPKGLEALILSSPLISTPRWIADNAVYVRQLPEKVQKTIAKHEKAGTVDDPEYTAAVDVFYARHMCRKNPCPTGDSTNDAPPFNEKLYRYMWGPSEFTANGTLKDFDLTPKLKDIKAPTLYICGQQDEATPKSCKYFAGLTPNARFFEVPESGHMTMWEQKKIYLGEIRSFLGMTPAG